MPVLFAGLLEKTNSWMECLLSDGALLEHPVCSQSRPLEASDDNQLQRRRFWGRIFDQASEDTDLLGGADGAYPLTRNLGALYPLTHTADVQSQLRQLVAYVLHLSGVRVEVGRYCTMRSIGVLSLYSHSHVTLVYLLFVCKLLIAGHCYSGPLPTFKLNTNNFEQDLTSLLGNAWLFYEAQQSGPITTGQPANRIPWRGDSYITDGAAANRDLIGGWYDAGDSLKLSMPFCSSVWPSYAYIVIPFACTQSCVSMASGSSLIYDSCLNPT